MTDAFFELVDDALVPSADARGPWSADMLHGRLIGGLAARAVEQTIGDPEFQPARLTVDMFKAAPLEPLRTEVTVTRAGGRVRAAEVSFRVGDVEVARSSALCLRRGPEPDNQVPSSPSWSDAFPEDLAPPENDIAFDIRFVPGAGFGAPGVRRVWCRETRRLVTGEDLTPFVRVGLIGDFANPFANSGTEGLDHINADITLYVARLPEGEWIGLESAERVAADGVATATCRLHDLSGPLGTTSVASVLTPRMEMPTESGASPSQ